MFDGPTTLIHGDCAEALAEIPAHSIDAIVTDPPAGIGFMGKAWDKNRGGRDHWIAWLADITRECLRVLKPGGHALVWALPRTSHWTATAVEDAGFDVRDVIMHVFGSGFPKSHNVSKAIDKAAGKSGSRGPMKRGGERLTRLTDGARDGGGVWGNEVGRNAYTTIPATDDARAWQGWGTALKPAAEHWILARKPLGSTVAACVLEHGTGAINVDACRVGTGGGETFHGPDTNGGRWPPHLLLTHDARCGDRCVRVCPVHEIDEQRGGASRFFPRFRYTPKPSTREKSEGLDVRNTHPTVKKVELMRWLVRLITPPGGIVLDPFMGSGTTGVAAIMEGAWFVGIEQSPEYMEIARKRIDHASRCHSG